MNGSLLLQADSLQVHWLVFEVLLIFTFLLHILLMNFMLGGSILNAAAAWRNLKTGGGTKHLPTTIALAVNFGVPPLLFVQVLYAKLFYTSSILMGVFWLAVIPLLILAYYTAYLSVLNKQRERAALFSTISAVLLLIIAFIYVNNLTLMLTPGQWGAYFTNPGGTLLHLSEPTLFPRFLHMVIGALAVASLGWAMWGYFAARKGDELGAVAQARGLRLFFWFTCLQMVLGLVWLILLPKDTMMLFMGKQLLATILLPVGILLAIGLLVMAWKGRLWATAWSAVLTLVVMILMRDIVRSGYLTGLFSPAELPVNLSISPLMLFLITFVVGLGLLAWMLKLALDPAYRVKEEGQS